MASFALENVTLGYDGHPAVHHLNGVLKQGSLTAVFGPNGSGKSTLLKGLSRLLHPMDGHIHLEGCAPEDVAYLPQASEIDRSFPIVVSDLVASGLWRTRGLFGAYLSDDNKRVSAAIATVGLNGFAERSLDTLSGGQFQRALFARLLVQDAKVILLDEPFAAIDAKSTFDLLAIMRRWHEEGRTILAVLHDVELVKANFPETILLARELVAWGKTAEVMSAANLSRARTIHEAWDENAPNCEAVPA